jgi:hypothetical protein
MNAREEFPDQFRIHETEADRDRELVAIEAFASRYGLAFEKTEFKGYQDAKLFYKGRYYALAETKWRNNPASKYPTYTIDKKKIDNLLDQALRDRVRPVLIVSWDGDVRWWDFDPIKEYWNFKIRLQQRADRRERPDLVYEIPVRFFRSLRSN